MSSEEVAVAHRFDPIRYRRGPRRGGRLQPIAMSCLPLSHANAPFVVDLECTSSETTSGEMNSEEVVGVRRFYPIRAPTAGAPAVG
jgi:hypothetical protein